MSTQKRTKSPQRPNANNPTSAKTARTPYTDWIHCNVCYEQYMRKSRDFYLLACDHVSCQQCTKEVKERLVNGPSIYTCSLCRQKTRACKMGNEMPMHLKEIFHPEPYLDGLNTCRILMFQQKHRHRFKDYLQRQHALIQEKKKVTIKELEEAKKNYQVLEELKVERKHLEKRVVGIKNQRKEMEEKRNSGQSGSSNSLTSQQRRQIATPTLSASTSSHSSGPRMPGPTRASFGSSGITSFSHHSPNHSFVL